VIPDCAGWKCRQWQQTCGVTLAEVGEPCALWTWKDGNLVLWNYPIEREAEVSAKRSGGRAGGKARARAQAHLEAQLEAMPQAELEALPEPELQRKGKERKEMEGKGKQDAPLPEVVPTGRRFGDHRPLCATINALRPEWARPAAWSAAELHALHGALGQFEELAEADWDLLRRFLAKPLEKAGAYWQPVNRGRFVETFPDVFASAQRWAGKTNGHRTRADIIAAKMEGTWK
jgi:hypothetical protein